MKISESELYSQLSEVVAAAESDSVEAPAVGVLTSVNRSRWSEARERLAKGLQRGCFCLFVCLFVYCCWFLLLFCFCFLMLFLFWLFVSCHIRVINFAFHYQRLNQGTTKRGPSSNLSP